MPSVRTGVIRGLRKSTPHTGLLRGQRQWRTCHPTLLVPVPETQPQPKGPWAAQDRLIDFKDSGQSWKGLEGHLALPLQLPGRVRPGAWSGSAGPRAETAVGGGREVGFRDLEGVQVTGVQFGEFMGQLRLLV